MKNLRVFIIWLAGVAIFLLLTAHFTLRHALNTPKFKTAITGFIERTTGRAADYVRIDYSIRPFSLVVRNAALKEQDGAQDFVSVRAFSVVLDWRRKELAALHLDRPAVRIRQRPDGTFNFSDLISGPPRAVDTVAPPARPAGEPPPAGGQAPPPRSQPAVPAPPRFSVRRVEIRDARIEFLGSSAGDARDLFVLSDLDFLLRDFAQDKPLQMNGSATIGKSSGLQFELSGPAMADHAGNLGAWPLNFTGRLDIRDFADIQAFLPRDTLPFRRLEMTWNAQGALADKLTVRLQLKTAEATVAYPLAFEAGVQAEAALPAPIVQHLLAGEALPPALQSEPPPCEPPAGTAALRGHSLAALLLRHAQAKAEITIPGLTHGRNGFEQGAATAQLHDGVLTIPRAGCTAYGGMLEARGQVQLLACPLSYRLDRLVAKDIALEQVLAANGLDGFSRLSGALQLEARAAGPALAGPGLRLLEADVRTRIDNLHSVGTGGSLMDQIWRQLDHPLLLKLVPRLKPKVDQARQAADNVTTSRYDEASATLSLRNGAATLSEARLAMPGYLLKVDGRILLVDDRFDLTAHLCASPEETARLTDGKDLSAYLPYENGGLSIPLYIRGPVREPVVRPDLDRLLQNALAGDGINRALENLSDSDSQHVQEGLRLLKNLGGLLQAP